MKWIAHRGSHLQTVENSMKAFECALKENYDGCECDIRLTSDDGFIVYHDETFKRLNHVKKYVSETSLHEATSMRYIDDHEQTILSLNQLLQFFHQKQKYLFIEIKDKLNERQIKSFIHLLSSYEIPYIIISFHLELLLQLRGLKCMWLVDKMHNKVMERIKDIPIKHVGCNVKYMTQKSLNQALNRGIEISLWTVNSNQSYWSNQKIQFITTDYRV